MPGYYVTMYAWHGLLPRAYWPGLMAGDSASLSGCIVGHEASMQVFGVFYLQSTREQDLRSFEVYFVAHEVSPMDWRDLLLVHPDKIAMLLRLDRPCYFLGTLTELWGLFGISFDGRMLYRGGRPLRIRVPIGRLFENDDASAADILLQHAMGGLSPPAEVEAPMWWMVPAMALDQILSQNYYQLYIMRDYGTDSWECVAVYGTTRLMSTSVSGIGVFRKFQLCGIPWNDPAKWWRYARYRDLGALRMFDWVEAGDVRSRL